MHCLHMHTKIMAKINSAENLCGWLTRNRDTTWSGLSDMDLLFTNMTHLDQVRGLVQCHQR